MIGDKIKELGSKPNRLGSLVAPVIGRFAGKAISLRGVEAVLKANIMIEKKTMRDYKVLH